ncbi:MAG: carbon-nitrogen hydrolase family protein [Sneathiella sp.]
MEIIRPSSHAEILPEDRLRVGLCQIAPIWFNREATLAKIADCVEVAASNDCQLVVFGEALAPGYPFWVELTDGARFNDEKQKKMYARYLKEGVVIERGDLKTLCDLARARNIAIYVGIMEKAPDRGGHSLYCSLVYIDTNGTVQSVHRKLQPTYEERLVWAQGDGHGLVVHDLEAFRVGGLNCYENWMPLSRAALYAQGEDLHVSVWPGGLHNTSDLPIFLAKESRSYVIACSGLMRPEDFPEDTPNRSEIIEKCGAFLANGGTAIASPDGTFLVEPVVGKEALVIADLDHAKVRGERQNLDIAGHYSRPDITRLKVDRRRQSIAEFID